MVSVTGRTYYAEESNQPCGPHNESGATSVAGVFRRINQSIHYSVDARESCGAGLLEPHRRRIYVIKELLQLAFSSLSGKKEVDRMPNVSSPIRALPPIDSTESDQGPITRFFPTQKIQK